MRLIGKVARYGVLVAVAAITALALLFAGPAEKTEAASLEDLPSYETEQTSSTFTVDDGHAQILIDGAITAVITITASADGVLLSVEAFDDYGQIPVAIVSVDEILGSQLVAANYTFAGDGAVTFDLTLADQVTTSPPTLTTNATETVINGVLSDLLGGAASSTFGLSAIADAVNPDTIPAGNAGLADEAGTSLGFVLALGALALVTLAGTRTFTTRGLQR